MKTRAFTASALRYDDGEIKLSFASELPYNGEILRMAGADLSRLEGGAVLLNHDRSRLVGVIRKAWIDGDMARALIALLPDSDDADMLRSALATGWRGDASVGYDYDMEDVRMLTREDFEVTKWRALEISLVTVPADATVGIGRSLDTHLEVMETKPDPVLQPAAASLDELDTLASRSLFASIPAGERIAAIRDLHAIGATARDAGQKLLQLAERAQPAAPAQDTRPACDAKDLPQFSLSRAALISAGKVRMDGIEGEVHQELSRRYPQRSPQGVCVPRELLAGHQRNNLATVNSVGGYLTTLDNRTDLLVPYLYPASIVARLGVTNLTGLRNSFTLPVGTAGVTAEYVGEAAGPSKSTPTLGQKSSTPKALSAYVQRSMQLLEQGGPGVDSWLRNELLNGAATKLDEVFLTGVGGAQPDGLFLLSGTNGVTFGGAAVWADVLEFLSDIENQKVTISNNAKWLTNPTVRRKWQTIEQSSGTARWLMDETPESRAAGYPTVASSAILTTGTYANRIAFGNWETVLFCEYFSPEIKVTEDATLARTGMVQISLLQHNDFVWTRPEALTVSTDTAAA